MAKVRLFGGKPLLVNGKVSLSDDCCCGGIVPCPPVEEMTNITIVSSDINTCTDCIDLTSTPFGNFGSFQIYANYLNTTKVVPPFFNWWQTDDPTLGVGQLDYPSDAPSPCTCPSPDPCTTTEDPTGLHFQIMCDDTGWKVELAAGLFIYFYAIELPDPTVLIANQLTTCGELINDPDFGAVWTGALGGTIQLTF